MAKLKYTFKTDTLFKMLFTRHQDLLKRLVAELLGIGHESIGRFEVANPEMPPAVLGGKFCRLDINMEVDGQLVNLEIQVRNEGGYPERALFNWARLYSSALPAGDDYLSLPRTVVINIVDFNLFECEEFHSEFRPLETTRHEQLSDRMSLHFFELRKVPLQTGSVDRLLLWLSLFRARTEEELVRIKAMGVPEVEQAIEAYRRITASPEFLEIERQLDKARVTEMYALNQAAQEATARAAAKWQAAVADREAKLADKDAELERIRAENEELRARLKG